MFARPFLISICIAKNGENEKSRGTGEFWGVDVKAGAMSGWLDERSMRSVGLACRCLGRLGAGLRAAAPRRDGAATILA